MNHTAEPWRITQPLHSSLWIEGSRREVVAEFPCPTEREKLDAERIVACVNFCAGAKTEVLKPGLLMFSFRDLADGTVVDVLTLSVDYERAKAENKKLREEIAELNRRLKLASEPL